MERNSKINNAVTRYNDTLNNLQISNSKLITSVNVFYQAVSLKQKTESNEELLLKTEQWVNNTLTNLIEVQKNILKKKKLIYEIAYDGQSALSIKNVEEIIRKLNQLEGMQINKVADYSPSKPWLSNQISQSSKKRK